MVVWEELTSKYCFSVHDHDISHHFRSSLIYFISVYIFQSHISGTYFLRFILTYLVFFMLLQIALFYYILVSNSLLVYRNVDFFKY